MSSQPNLANLAQKLLVTPIQRATHRSKKGNYLFQSDLGLMRLSAKHGSPYVELTFRRGKHSSMLHLSPADDLGDLDAILSRISRQYCEFQDITINFFYEQLKSVRCDSITLGEKYRIAQNAVADSYLGIASLSEIAVSYLDMKLLTNQYVGLCLIGLACHQSHDVILLNMPQFTDSDKVNFGSVVEHLYGMRLATEKTRDRLEKNLGLVLDFRKMAGMKDCNYKSLTGNIMTNLSNPLKNLKKTREN